MIATKTEGNVVKELNWEPAMMVYRSLVGDQVADSLEVRNIQPEAKRYPFGIARDDLEDIVRDPIRATETGELVVLSGVPEHSVMHILKGDNEKLIAAAQQLAADFGKDNSDDQCIVFDCYSRAMLLGQDFQRELTGFADVFWKNRPNTQLVGALALDEIASDGLRTPDFQNKTIAAGLISRGN